MGFIFFGLKFSEELQFGVGVLVSQVQGLRLVSFINRSGFQVFLILIYVNVFIMYDVLGRKLFYMLVI